jgi:adenylate cyclase
VVRDHKGSDAVNIASRLETLAKEFDCELLMSNEVVARAGLERKAFHWEEVTIRGRRETLAVAVVATARDLPEPDGHSPRLRERAV